MAIIVAIALTVVDIRSLYMCGVCLFVKNRLIGRSVNKDNMLTIK